MFRRQFLKLTGALAASIPLCSAAERTVGLIYPSSKRPVPPEASTLYPSGVRFLVEGMRMDVLPDDFDHVIERAIPVANKLSRDGAGAIILMAPPVSFYKGANFNRQLSDAIARATGLPSITASNAIAEGLKTVRAHRVAIVTVYTDEVSLYMQGFLEESGFEVVTVRGLDIERFEEPVPVTEIITRAELLEFCASVRESRPEADALLIASSYLPTLDLIVPLEKRCQIPVVTATPHALRAGVRLAGLTARVAGFGTLFDL